MMNDLKKIHNPIFVDGYPDTNNFGDALNVPLVEYLSDKKVYPSRNISFTKYNSHVSYAVIGSVCQLTRSKSIVWGAGFPDGVILQKRKIPNKVYAVRGPLTRDIYLKNNIPCPAIYGDPALLLPLIYDPYVDTEYEYGVIYHFLDWGADWVKSLRDRPNVLMIDVMTGVDYQSFITQMKKSKKIITNSLHGLIMAHAYKIPVCLVELNHGTDFKFKDYLLSVNKSHVSATVADKYIDPDKLNFDSECIEIDLEPLINSCPFILERRKTELLEILKVENLYSRI